MPKKVITLCIPVIGTLILYFGTNKFGATPARIEIYVFSACSVISSLTALCWPKLFLRNLVANLVCIVPYVGFSTAAFVCWKLNLGPDISQMGGFALVAILALMIFSFPVVFLVCLVAGFDFYTPLKNLVIRIPIRILPPEDPPESKG